MIFLQRMTKTMCEHMAKRLFSNLRLRQFFGLFWPIFNSHFGGYIRSLILPPKSELKIGSKEPKNRQKLSSRTVSKETDVKYREKNLKIIINI
jgi:hypothetical protein